LGNQGNLYGKRPYDMDTKNMAYPTEAQEGKPYTISGNGHKNQAPVEDFKNIDRKKYRLGIKK
jgi:hypothetical protein